MSFPNSYVQVSALVFCYVKRALVTHYAKFSSFLFQGDSRAQQFAHLNSRRKEKTTSSLDGSFARLLANIHPTADVKLSIPCEQHMRLSCGRRLDEIPQQLETAHGICFQRRPSLFFAWRKTPDSDLRHSRDQYQWGVRRCFA